MTAACDAAIRPFPDDTEVRCANLFDDDGLHSGLLRDFAYPGSVTVIDWRDTDRRCFHGDWPGRCTDQCPLPAGHQGGHVHG